MMDIIIRKYKSSDYRDIVNSGYPFDAKSLGTIGHLKTKLQNILGLIKEDNLVAFDRNKEMVVGIVTLRRITNTLWHMWDIFVHPDLRGRGIASLIYRSSFQYCAERGGRKAVESVAVDNVASIKSITKTWDDFLSQRFYKVPNVDTKLTNLPYQLKISRVSISHLRKDERDALFATYKNCVNEDLLSFLEINRDNFLERFIDFHPYSGPRARLLSIISNKYILFDKDKCAEGYAVTIGSKMRRSAILYLYISKGSSDKTVILLLLKAIQELRLKGIKAYMVCVTCDELQLHRILSKLNLQAIPYLIAIKYL
jgi:predicted acetyltransferase